jgi:hypothetical protein
LLPTQHRLHGGDLLLLHLLLPLALPISLQRIADAFDASLHARVGIVRGRLKHRP